jgi:hypothetical protein
MEPGLFRRRTVALIAAYAVALQTLFSAFAPMAVVASGSFAVLCTHDDSDGNGPPGQHELPCAALCAAMAQGVAGPVPPGVVVARAEPVAFAAGLDPVSDWVTPPLAVTDSHTPRGPPLA